MNRADLKAKAKEQIKGNIGTLFIIMLIIGAILGAVAAVPAIGFASIIIQGPFIFAQSIIYLNLTHKKKPEVADAFIGFKENDFVRSFVASLLISLFTFLWSLLLIIPGIVKALSYSMTYYIMAENPNMSAQDAIRASQELTRGYKSDLFVLYLSFIGWGILVSLTFGILLIYVGPYVQSTLANFYNYLKEQKNKAVTA